LNHPGCVLDGYRGPLVGDLEIVAAVVGIAADAAAEEQSDARVDDPLVVVIPVAVAPKRNFPGFDDVETRLHHRLTWQLGKGLAHPAVAAVEDYRHRAVVHEFEFH